MVNEKNRYIRMLWLLPVLPLFSILTTAASAEGKDLSDSEVAKILVRCSSVFEQNSLVSSVFRFLGWLIMKLLAKLSSACESLYDTCFKFVDFTSYSKVEQYIDKFQVVWIALVCLSLMFLGIILVFWQDKKPKFVLNLLIAVLVVSSSGFIIDKMNGFLNTSVKKELMGSGGTTATYSVVGSNVRDLLYLDAEVGIESLYDKNKDGIRNYKGTYENLSKKQFELMDINATLDPSDYSGSLKKVLEVHPVYVPDGQVEKEKNSLGFIAQETTYKVGDESYTLQDVYDGVAWTDLLNEHYYRYTVDWLPAYLELLSLIIVYLFMSYKVIRSLYEIAVNRLLAYLYSANLSGGKKILKILDSIKDTYIVLIFTMICIKFYLMATGFLSTMNMNGISKGLILLFLAFALLDGPNMVQKLTGMDAGMSDGMGKMLGMFYGSQMVGSVAHTAAGMAKGAGGLLIKPFAGGFLSGASGMADPPAGSRGSNPDGGMLDPSVGSGGDNPGGGMPDPSDGNRGSDPDGRMPDPNRESTGENLNPDMGEDREGRAAEESIPDPGENVTDETMPDVDTTMPGSPTEEDMAENGGSIADETMEGGSRNTLSDGTGSPDSGQGSDGAFSDNDPLGQSGKNGRLEMPAGSGKEELLNGMDPAAGSMAESLASAMENMERDLGGISGQGISGKNSSLLHSDPVRHAGSMFSPDRHSNGRQNISHSATESPSKMESQVERSMAFENNETGGDAS